MVVRSNRAPALLYHKSTVIDLQGVFRLDRRRSLFLALRLACLGLALCLPFRLALAFRLPCLALALRLPCLALAFRLPCLALRLPCRAGTCLFRTGCPDARGAGSRGQPLCAENNSGCQYGSR